MNNIVLKLVLLLIIMLMVAGCKSAETPEKSLKNLSESNNNQDNSAVILEPDLNKESQGNIDEDLADIEGILQEDENDVYEDQEISNQSLGIE